MTRRLVGLFAAVSALAYAAGCLDFDTAYSGYCADGGRCSQLDGGSGGGSGGTGGGTGASGGGSGGSGGGTGGGSGGGTGGTGGGSGGSGGGTGGAGGGTAGPACDAGLCYVRHYDTPYRDMWAVFEAAPNAVWAGSGGGLTVLFNGSTFTPMQLPQTQEQVWEISASGPNDVYASGENGTVIHHWDGTGWAPLSTQASYPNYGVYAPRPGRAFAGAYGALSVYDGTSWAIGVDPGNPTPDDVHGCDDTTVYVPTYSGPIYRYSIDGGFDMVWDGGVDLESIWCHPTGGVWSVGAEGLVVHSTADGGFDVFDAGVGTYLNAVWVSDLGDVWMGGSNRTLVRYRNWGAGARTAYNVQPFGIYTYTDIHGLGDELWVTGIYANASGDGGAVIQYRVGP